MDRWPQVDKALRARLLAGLRSRQRRAAADLSPAERIARLLDMSVFARRPGSRRARALRPTDESLEVLSAMKARLRKADGDT